MSDEAATSKPAPEKEPSKKANEDENPTQHGAGASEGSEAGGAPGEGRTGTGLGSTDS